MRWRHATLIAAIAVCAAVTFAQPPIPQPLDYHQFADTRPMLGVPNGLDVLSNLPFAIVGIAGLVVVFHRRNLRSVSTSWERLPYAVLFAGVTLTAVGSSYYHLAPDNDRLVWDRLPMAIGFMGLLAAIVAERVSVRAAKFLLAPLLAVGCASVAYWHWTELGGRGDLRVYLLVQFGSLIVIVLLLALYPPRHRGTGYLVAGLAAYAAAKGLESADRVVFSAGHLVSGHTLKHLAAAAGVACVVAMLKVRSAVTVRPRPLHASVR